jgi:hypothetical protein
MILFFEDSYFKFELAETKKFEDEVQPYRKLICTWIISRSKNKNRRSLSGRIIVYKMEHTLLSLKR